MQKIAFSTLLFFYSIILFSQEEFTLSECIDYARNNAWSVEESFLNIKDAEAQIREFRAIGLPQLNLTANYQYFIEFPTSIIPAGSFGPMNPEEELPVQFGVKNNLTAGVELNQLLFDGSYLVGLQAVKKYVNLVQAQRELSDFELHFNVEEAFYNVLLAKAQREVIENDVQVLQAIIDESRAVYEEGFIEALDVDRLELNLKNLITARNNQDKFIELSKNGLKLMMNFPVREKIMIEGSLADEVKDELLAQNVENITTDAIDRPESAVLEANRLLQELAVKRDRYSRYPRLAAFGAYNQQLQGNKLAGSQWFPNSLVGLNLSVPIFNGFDIRSKLERSQIALDKVELEQGRFDQLSIMEFENAKLSLENARANFQMAQESNALSQKIYDVSLIKFKEGVGSSVELNQAQQGMYSSRSQFLKAEYDLVIAYMNLRKALGQ